MAHDLSYLDLMLRKMVGVSLTLETFCQYTEDSFERACGSCSIFMLIRGCVDVQLGIGRLYINGNTPIQSA